MIKSLRDQIEDAERAAEKATDLRQKAKPSKVRRHGGRMLLRITWPDGVEADFDYLDLRQEAEEKHGDDEPARH